MVCCKDRQELSLDVAHLQHLKVASSKFKWFLLIFENVINENLTIIFIAYLSHHVVKSAGMCPSRRTKNFLMQILLQIYISEIRARWRPFWWVRRGSVLPTIRSWKKTRTFFWNMILRNVIIQTKCLSPKIMCTAYAHMLFKYNWHCPYWILKINHHIPPSYPKLQNIHFKYP